MIDYFNKLKILPSPIIEFLFRYSSQIRIISRCPNRRKTHYQGKKYRILEHFCTILFNICTQRRCYVSSYKVKFYLPTKNSSPWFICLGEIVMFRDLWFIKQMQVFLALSKKRVLNVIYFIGASKFRETFLRFFIHTWYQTKRRKMWKIFHCYLRIKINNILQPWFIQIFHNFLQGSCD